MKNIIIKDKIVSVIGGWEEISIEKYLKLQDLYTKQQNGEILPELFIIKFIPLISDLLEEDLYSMYEEDLQPFTKIFEEFSQDLFVVKPSSHFTFNGVDYVATNNGKLTMGEIISQKLLEKGSISNIDSIYNLLSIIVRPAIVKTNEFGETIYEAVPFDADIDILLKRKELFKNLPAVNAMYIVESFINGKKK